MTELIENPGAVTEPLLSVVDKRLNKASFYQLAASLAGQIYVKFVYDRSNKTMHFLNSTIYKLHAFYIAENLLAMSTQEMGNRIDEFNQKFYFEQDRRFILGILSLNKVHSTEVTEESTFLVLESTEVDLMHEDLICEFINVTRKHLDMHYQLLWKPANHHQENIAKKLDEKKYPRIYARELYASKNYVALNPGTVNGRIRVFPDIESYRTNRHSITWYDILVMHRVPDDIPRVSGIINAEHTAPLSHTNVLAKGWHIPNCVQIGVLDLIKQENLENSWVEFVVSDNASDTYLTKIPTPAEIPSNPAWISTEVNIDVPEIKSTPIRSLGDLRASDRHRFGTKAANLGELHHLYFNGSDKLLGFYRIPRPPRPNLLGYFDKFVSDNFVGTQINHDLVAHQFLRTNARIPRGIAIPFSFIREFLESSPALQQYIGKLKFALEMNARQVDSLSITIQKMIRDLEFPKHMRESIMWYLENDLAGVNAFVVRSSSNAEDLNGFSAAGVYESVNHVTTQEKILESIKIVWASLVSPRAVHLRQEAGISLDDAYMGVIIQEQLPMSLGGVMVTSNPVNAHDFRNVYLNVSGNSVEQVVQGTEIPMQFLYNAVEGGGRTISLGNSTSDLSTHHKDLMQKLSVVGKLLQGHFSPDESISQPVDIEWLINENGIYLLQLRPYGS